MSNAVGALEKLTLSISSTPHSTEGSTSVRSRYSRGVSSSGWPVSAGRSSKPMRSRSCSDVTDTLK